MEDFFSKKGVLEGIGSFRKDKRFGRRTRLPLFFFEKGNNFILFYIGRKNFGSIRLSMEKERWVHV